MLHCLIKLFPRQKHNRIHLRFRPSSFLLYFNLFFLFLSGKRSTGSSLQVFSTSYGLDTFKSNIRGTVPSRSQGFCSRSLKQMHRSPMGSSTRFHQDFHQEFSYPNDHVSVLRRKTVSQSRKRSSNQKTQRVLIKDRETRLDTIVDRIC